MNTDMSRVCVANLPPDIRIKDIDDFFRPFGEVVNIDVNNRSNPVYAYVQFDTPRNAYNAVRSRHGYDYEGYTLQMRLIESEVNKRREFTPPLPTPPIINNYDRQITDGPNNFGMNYNRMAGTFPNSSFAANRNSQWTNNNINMAQQSQSMPQYTTSNRNMSQLNMNYPANIRQQDMRMRPDTGRENVLDQFSNNNPNMQQFPNSNFSNMNDMNRSNIQQNMNFPNRSGMMQQNSMSHSGNVRSNMQDQYNSGNMRDQMGMMDYSKNSSWNNNNNMNQNFGNHGFDQNDYNNAGHSINEGYNLNNNFGRNDFDTYTNDLSSDGRRSSRRYMQNGFTPANTRTKALEHRNVPYARDAPRNKPAPGGDTNAALETIGNTLMSLLSANQLDSFQQGGGNFGMSGPSSSKSQTPRNVVSKPQYLKSISYLRQLKLKRNLSSKDEVSRKYHTQIVKDFETFTRESRKLEGLSSFRDVMNARPAILHKSGEKLEDQLRRKKGQLLKAAKSLTMGKEGAKRLGGAYKKRINILMHDAGFSDIEAKALAVHPLEKLKDLIALKQEYDLVNKKTDFMPTNHGSLKRSPRIVVYRNDMKYLKSYQELKISKLSSRIITALNDCITRIHKYEREEKLPYTGGKFVTLLQKIAKKSLSQKGNKSYPKRNATATTTANKKNVEKNDNEKNNKNVIENKQVKTVTKTVTKAKEDKNVTEAKKDITEGNTKICVKDEKNTENKNGE